jgi:formamidopyrimidine-DNA glycosylase
MVGRPCQNDLSTLKGTFVPELPEVETVARTLRRTLVGRKVIRVLDASPLMIDVESTKRLRGRRIEAVDRQGKWMFVRLDGAEVLVVHLGMTGWVGVTTGNCTIAPHTHFRATLDQSGKELRFVDPRRFGEWTLMKRSDWESRFGPKQLGPDALCCTLDDLQGRLKRTTRRIKPTLMDQRVVAGVGNIYADEILHQAKLAPTRRADTLKKDEVARLHGSMIGVLQSAVEGRGTTIHSFVGSDGQEGGFQTRLLVYGRAGQYCSICRSLIQCSPAVVAGRSTYWCPGCQPARKTRRKARPKARHVVSHD